MQGWVRDVRGAAGEVSRGWTTKSPVEFSAGKGVFHTIPEALQG